MFLKCILLLSVKYGSPFGLTISCLSFSRSVLQSLSHSCSSHSECGFPSAQWYVITGHLVCDHGYVTWTLFSYGRAAPRAVEESAYVAADE